MISDLILKPKPERAMVDLEKENAALRKECGKLEDLAEKAEDRADDAERDLEKALAAAEENDELLHALIAFWNALKDVADGGADRFENHLRRVEDDVAEKIKAYEEKLK